MSKLIVTDFSELGAVLDAAAASRSAEAVPVAAPVSPEPTVAVVETDSDSAFPPDFQWWSPWD